MKEEKNETAMDIYSNWGSVRLKYASCLHFLDKCKLQKNEPYFSCYDKKEATSPGYFFPCTVFSKDNPRLYIIVLVYLVLPSGAFWASR